ncbi:hypothetical protein OE88DRAFT_1727886 [Heliocybe sulcata]|uniref:Defective in cullin neddylation protein n=1 Tax=Heliocybe sulcata TaxID=5364 RepID=A0A5C3MT19_9AGAM|nr:hypothetical protein OE88DRAFT_1727886 [Heliocybe sulcata]
MKASLLRLRDKLGSDPHYFQQVYSHTFDFARPEGARVLSVETAQAFWGLLLPHGLQGGALAHIPSKDGDDDVDMGGSQEGWQEEHIQWWFDFLNEKAGKGVSKDTWMMFLDFVRTIDSKFVKYDEEARCDRGCEWRSTKAGDSLKIAPVREGEFIKENPESWLYDIPGCSPDAVCLVPAAKKLPSHRYTLSGLQGLVTTARYTHPGYQDGWRQQVQDGADLVHYNDPAKAFRVAIGSVGRCLYRLYEWAHGPQSAVLLAPKGTFWYDMGDMGKKGLRVHQTAGWILAL